LKETPSRNSQRRLLENLLKNNREVSSADFAKIFPYNVGHINYNEAENKRTLTTVQRRSLVAKVNHLCDVETVIKRYSAVTLNNASDYGATGSAIKNRWKNRCLWNCSNFFAKFTVFT